MQQNHPFQTRPPLFLYHEPPPYEWRRPEYLNLCLETVRKHCGRRFRVIPLTRYDVYKYVPDLRQDVWVKCTYAQRVDLMRWELLSRYGGAFLDPDVLVMQDLSPLVDKLATHDVVAFGTLAESVADAPLSSARTSSSAYTSSSAKTSSSADAPFRKPLTWAMCSRPRGELVTLCKERAHWILDNDEHRLRTRPHLLGREMMWHCMALLGERVNRKHVWSYYHVDSACAECDSQNVLFTKPRLLTNEPYDVACASRVFVVPLNTDGSRSCAFPRWFVEASREQLLGNGRLLVSRLWRWSLLGEGV